MHWHAGWLGLLMVLGLIAPIQAAEPPQLELDPEVFTPYGSGAAKRLQAEFQRHHDLARQGDREAQYQLGLCYQLGAGTRRDEQQARLWFLKAAEQGHSGACMSLAQLFWVGKGGRQDRQAAIRWYRQAADHGEVGAQVFLGTIFWLGEGVPRDHGEARHFFERAAQSGAAEGQYALGMLYAQQDPPDYAAARGWLTQAAEQGYPEAQRALGVYYLKGWGGPIDFAQAAHWLRRAAELGQVEVYYLLGMLHGMGGHGLPQDPVAAFSWYTLGAETDDEAARAELAEIRPFMTPEQLELAEKRLEELRGILKR